MTAVANLPSLQQNNRLRWNVSSGQATFDAVNAEIARKLIPRKSTTRSNSSPSIPYPNSLSSSITTVQSKFQVNGAPMSASAVETGMWGATGMRKRTTKMGPWPNRKSNSMSNFKAPSIRPQSNNITNDQVVHSPEMTHPSQQTQNLPSLHAFPSSQKSNGGRSQAQPVGESLPILCLVSMNGTFDRKTISVPFYPETVRIGRQTNTKTIPTSINGYFDSKVLSRQHAEIWADRDGKIWIRDIKSSNGTFVNGARLSLENQDSEPHELEAQDQLELGIDIVSEDQKTVVHHKVAAKVEYTGYAGTSNNYIETNFEDFDNATSINLGLSQSSIQMRGRLEPQSSVGSINRLGTSTSITNSQVNLGQQRQMKLWLTPVTMEQIVKRLTHEMRMARLQADDLGKANDFLGSLLRNDHTGEADKPQINEAFNTAALANNLSRSEPTTCFSAPPAPPPQQPLPEKPDFTRSIDSVHPHHFKRSSIERSRSISNISPARSETPNQIVTLIEALASAKKEIDSQGMKLRDLEELLRKEKQARTFAEEIAKRLESQFESKKNGILTVGLERSVMEEAFEPCLEVAEHSDFGKSESLSAVSKIENESDRDKWSINCPQNCLETIFTDVGELKEQIESYRVVADTPGIDQDLDQKSLAEMVEKIRLEEAERNKVSSNFSRQCEENSEVHNASEGAGAEIDTSHKEYTKQDLKSNFKSQNPWVSEGEPTFGILAKKSNDCESFLSQNTAPFASMLGIVIIGVGIMSYLNGWQVMKAER